MGSSSDWETMKHACDILEELNVPYEKQVVSAHRTPDLMFEYAEQARGRGIQVIIAGAGLAAHLPGVIASHTILPVIGIPLECRSPQSNGLAGMDALFSIVQMPKQIPVATVGINNAENAAYLALQILALSDVDLKEKLISFRKKLVDEALLNGACGVDL